MTEANRILLGVNVDHVATLRQARGTRYPDPVKAALDAEDVLAAAPVRELHGPHDGAARRGTYGQALAAPAEGIRMAT